MGPADLNSGDLSGTNALPAWQLLSIFLLEAELVADLIVD
jgi:hypothetical protein